MRVKKLIEKLEDLATFFSLAAADAGEHKEASHLRGEYTAGAIWEGRQVANREAYNKVDKIIGEAKIR